MKKILEIGGGTTPYFVRFDIPWKEGDSYTCVDVNEKRLRESRDSVLQLSKNGFSFPQNVEYLVADGVSLSLPDTAFDEVVLSNILSAPIHYNWNEAGDTVTIKNEDSILERKIMGKKEDGDLFIARESL
jgi:ubiquinone/menaquinone biosynthesis C-methylase UbiE